MAITTFVAGDTESSKANYWVLYMKASSVSTCVSVPTKLDFDSTITTKTLLEAELASNWTDVGRAQRGYTLERVDGDTVDFEIPVTQEINRPWQFSINVTEITETNANALISIDGTRHDVLLYDCSNVEVIPVLYGGLVKIKPVYVNGAQSYITVEVNTTGHDIDDVFDHASVTDS